MALKGSYGQLKWSNERQHPLQLGNLFLWTGTSCYIGLKKKRQKVSTKKYLSAEKKNHVMSSSVSGPSSAKKTLVLLPCVKVLFPYAIGLALETHPNILFLLWNFLGADRLHGSSETAMKLQLVQLLGSKSTKSIWVLLAHICYCWYFIVVPLQMILYSCLMKIDFCYSLCIVNIEKKNESCYQHEICHFYLLLWLR